MRAGWRSLFQLALIPQQPLGPLGSDPPDQCACSVFGRVGTMGALFAQLAACCDEFANAGSDVIAAASTRSFLARNPGARVRSCTRMGSILGADRCAAHRMPAERDHTHLTPQSTVRRRGHRTSARLRCGPRRSRTPRSSARDRYRAELRRDAEILIVQCHDSNRPCVCRVNVLVDDGPFTPSLLRPYVRPGM